MWDEYFLFISNYFPFQLFFISIYSLYFEKMIVISQSQLARSSVKYKLFSEMFQAMFSGLERITKLNFFYNFKDVFLFVFNDV